MTVGYMIGMLNEGARKEEKHYTNRRQSQKGRKTLHK